MKIRHAIFDLDGTLTDSNGIWFDTVKEYIDKYCDYTADMLPEIFWNEIIFGGTYESLAYLKKTMGEKRTPDEIMEIIMTIAKREYGKERQKKKGALEFLKKIKESGADICVVTATPTPLAENGLRLSGLLPYIDFIISGEERPSGKEKPYIFLEAAARMNCDTCECVLFEDALYSLRVGKSLGMTTVAIDDFFCTEKTRDELRALCDLYIYDYFEIVLD